MFSWYALLPPLRGKRRKKNSQEGFHSTGFFSSLHCAEAMGEEIDPILVLSELTAPASQDIKAGRSSELSKLGHREVKRNT